MFKRIASAGVNMVVLGVSVVIFIVAFVLLTYRGAHGGPSFVLAPVPFRPCQGSRSHWQSSNAPGFPGI